MTDGFTPPEYEEGDEISAAEWSEAMRSMVTSVRGDGRTIMTHRRGNAVAIESIPQETEHIFALLTGTGASTGTFTGDECDAAGTTLSSGRTFDSSNAGVLHDLNGIDGWYNSSSPLVVEVARGTDTSPDPSEAYWYIRHVLGTSSSPATVGASNETESAATDSWDRTSQGANDGVTITCQTRTAYDDAGSETLYAYYRDFKYDSLGYLYEITAETRVTIDIPEAC